MPKGALPGCATVPSGMLLGCSHCEGGCCWALHGEGACAPCPLLGGQTGAVPIACMGFAGNGGCPQVSAGALFTCALGTVPC